MEGGETNARAFTDYASALIGHGDRPQPADPLLKAGIWWPGRGVVGVEEWKGLVASAPSSLVQDVAPAASGLPLSAGQTAYPGSLSRSTVTPPSGLPAISPSRGEIDSLHASPASSGTAPSETLSTNASSGGDAAWFPRPISPLEGEMAGRPEGGKHRPAPIVALCFYRALVQSGETKPVEAMIEALRAEGLIALPVFVSSLKDAVSVETLRAIFAEAPPAVVVNATGFAVSAPGAKRMSTVLDEGGAVVLQALFSSSTREAWAASSQGLSARDLAMNVALPEVDGRVMTRAVSFKAAARFDARVEANIVTHAPDADRCAFVARLAANWARLRQAAPPERRVALILANYPNRDGRLGNGVGLDTPAGTVEVLRALQSAGYAVGDLPADGDALINHLMAGPTNAATRGREIRETLSLNDYMSFFKSLPRSVQDAITSRWGDPLTDPFFRDGRFALPLSRFGHVVVGIQPARGYNIDPKETYHSPDLVPPHGYLAFYAYLRLTMDVHAVIHMGKHGNLEWLPGKALALSETCYPEAILGPLPHLYPFIVNDPGEGTQAKRRTAAVIIDHLTPPLTRAESYGPLKDLEALVDEYYEAAGGDPRRLRLLKKQILDLIADIGLDQDAGISKGEADETALEKLDAYLCDLKEMQIRDGLHIFGLAPEGRLLTDLTVALARVPRALGEGGDQSLQRAIAADLHLISPLEGEMSAKPTEGGIASETSRRSPPSALPGISPSRGEIGARQPPASSTPASSGTAVGLSSFVANLENGRVASSPISPLEGEMSAKPTEGGIAIETSRRSPPSALPGISPSRGEIGARQPPASSTPASSGTAVGLASSAANLENGRVASSPISPLEGEMPGRAEGGISGTDSPFDPLDCIMSDPWTGPKPAILAALDDAPWRTKGDTVERIELLAARLVDGMVPCPDHWPQARAVLDEIETRLKPSIIHSGPAEIAGLLTGLNGCFVAPGPSGAPTRGRPDVLPTGRNFYSVDSRAVPTPAAYELGKNSAELLVIRYAQDHGEWPTSLGITAWGTSNMRTGGDDIAQALALIGVKPLWDMASRRVTGFEILPQAVLNRPRVDVTLRISGFFRDAFPEQIALFDKAVRAVGALDEDDADNPIAARMRVETARLIQQGLSDTDAARRAGYRVFGSKPGAYGAGLQALIDEKGWQNRADLAEAYLVWGSYAYGAGSEGNAERGLFEERLRSVKAVVQNQDNREHDLLDSDDYYQFEGGMTAAIEHVAGKRPSVYHNDHSRPEKPVIRSLEEEIARVVRARVVNPKWIDGVMRHGYKGAFEIAATVDYMFAFSATTGAVRDHHFEAVYQAFVLDDKVRDFMADKNPAALTEMAERLKEAIDRGLWTPRSNSAMFDLTALARQNMEKQLEDHHD
ncbi:cobaltochelatase subunit CobN [Rhizobium sp. CG5]|nr:cobaltochelatase subunit CobN [Rhizobium sp. CG5]